MPIPRVNLVIPRIPILEYGGYIVNYSYFSSRVMEKTGMQFEGILRQQIFAKGSFFDVKLYSLLRSDLKG
jgi:RimJ/RimL family protein N-acetyltransferase